MLLFAGLSVIPGLDLLTELLPWLKLAFEANNPLVMFPLAFICLVIFFKVTCRLMHWEYDSKVVPPVLDDGAWTRNFSPHGGRNEKSDSSPRRPTRRRE